jgi:ectoine hydroxylase-related dioxygenase (phytanoyl-CoA dioxygenase family)
MTIDAADVRKPKLSYDYELDADRLDRIVACTAEHGFCVAKEVLSPAMVDVLCSDVWRVVDPDRTLGPGESRTYHAWFDEATEAWALLDDPRFMNLPRALLGTDEICVNRSAAIIRRPGSATVGWHTDWRGQTDDPPRDSGQVLNRGSWPSGIWFYVTGSRPTHGGLCVIEDSNRIDWPGPEGFRLTADRYSFVRADGADAERYDDFDIPGLVPLFTDPGDCILFADRTFHGAFPNGEERTRLSCGCGFRKKSDVIDAPWELPATARAFIDALPERHKRYVDGYTGIDTSFGAAR